MKFLYELIQKRNAEKERLKHSNIGDYIISLYRKVVVEDAQTPYYYFSKEYFIREHLDSFEGKLTQITGEDFGTVLENVKVETGKDGKTIISAGDYFGTIEPNQFVGKIVTTQTLCDLAEDFNSEAKAHAMNDYAVYLDPAVEIEEEVITEPEFEIEITEEPINPQLEKDLETVFSNIINSK